MLQKFKHGQDVYQSTNIWFFVSIIISVLLLWYLTALSPFYCFLSVFSLIFKKRRTILFPVIVRIRADNNIGIFFALEDPCFTIRSRSPG
jgi:hypothetical protein